MSRDDSATTSTERSRMVDRQLRRRGIEDERVLAAMEEVPRELLPPARTCGGAPTATARCGSARARRCRSRGSWPAWPSSSSWRATRPCSRSAPGPATRPPCSRASAAQVVTIERFESLAAGARAVLAELGYDNVEVRVGDGAQGRTRPSAVRWHLGDRHRPRRSATGRSSISSPQAPRSCARSTAAGASSSCAFATGRRRRSCPVRFVPLVADEP